MRVVSHRFDTTDVDDAVEVFSAAYSGGGLHVSDLGDFHYSQEYTGAPEVATVTQRLGARLESSAEPGDALVVAWTESGRTSYRMGRRQLAADEGMLWSAREPLRADVQQAHIGTINMDRADFEARAARLLGRELFVLPSFVPLQSTSGVDLARRHFRALRDVYLHDDFVDAPLAWHAMKDLTVAVVLAAAGLGDDADPVPPVPSQVRRALTFIDDNVARAISVGDIAAAAGLSARGLQASFRRTTGETPTARLRRARLERVRAELVAADPAVDSVAAIARRWGFTHLGRFAQLYERRYGELPSQTLRR